MRSRLLLLCRRLLPRFGENYLFGPAVNCEALKAAVHRAFNLWSANNKYINFVDVTAECAKIGQPWKGCELAELWLSAGAQADDRRGLQDDTFLAHSLSVPS